MKKDTYMLRTVDKNTRWLKIAGFLIRINFLKLDYEIIKNNIIHMVDSFSSEFQIKPNDKKAKVDLSIDIKQAPIADFVLLDKSKNAFVKLFSISDNNHRISTFYSISPHQFQLTMMHALFWLLNDHGFIAHCSAVKIKDEVLIFIGKSGAGKSTTANLLSDYYEILADDCGVIKEEYGKYYFYQALTRERNENIKRSSERYPIRAIFFLKKAPTYKIVKTLNREFIFKKMSQSLGENQKKLKQKAKFLLKMEAKFNNFYFLYFGKDRIRLKQLIDNEYF